MLGRLDEAAADIDLTLDAFAQFDALPAHAEPAIETALRIAQKFSNATIRDKRLERLDGIAERLLPAGHRLIDRIHKARGGS
jgi:hypothetical protein